VSPAQFRDTSEKRLFFRRRPSAARTARSPGNDLLVEQLLTAAGDGMQFRVQHVL